ncbi:putative glycosyltransferase [Rubellimicrobium mesophilum DSM 19309]|uniref:Putative glycosyltransferase n=1 Tax=Rubellimicrobium mesophilum DSM 19309 TaxID=442562 RepID=A0A017HL64_9RHOB|nr:putative glycosyltransferase [Rubellimicrobium mesophilum DSM 19309]
MGPAPGLRRLGGRRAGAGRAYPLAKRGFDLVGAGLLLVPLALAALALLALNPWLNRGRLFFVQERMGRHGRPFRAWKFRTMAAAPIERGAFDPLDRHRITPLGQLLRRARVDELPQALNVLKGEMSLIGPRPDYYPHALVYADTVPGYRDRHAVKPGISGLAQTELGYADGPDGIRAKVQADLLYVRTASLALDLRIARKTLAVILHRQGA